MTAFAHAHPHTHDTPTPSADITRARDISHLAKTVLPGPIGDLIYHELQAWAEFGYRFDKAGRGMALADHVERLYRLKAMEVTYG